MNLFYQPFIPTGVFHLEPEESRHCVKVLRKKNGDAIRITDGKGTFYDALITHASPSACSFTVTAEVRVPAPSYTVHIAISPTKNADRIEWFVEKAVELGIHKITLLDCENTERSYIKTDRLNKVAISAMKQSLKAFLPEVQALTSFSDVIQAPGNLSRFIAYVDSANPLHLKDAAQPAQQYMVLIGPEGDFTPGELDAALQKGFYKVSLGLSRLRTETAGLAACHILNLINT